MSSTSDDSLRPLSRRCQASSRKVRAPAIGHVTESGFGLMAEVESFHASDTEQVVRPCCPGKGAMRIKLCLALVSAVLVSLGTLPTRPALAQGLPLPTLPIFPADTPTPIATDTPTPTPTANSAATPTPTANSAATPTPTVNGGATSTPTPTSGANPIIAENQQPGTDQWQI